MASTSLIRVEKERLNVLLVLSDHGPIMLVSLVPL